MNLNSRVCNFYPVRRFPVKNHEVSWSEPFPEYEPPNYSAPHLKNASSADPDIFKAKFKWNEVDHGINRRSYDQGKIIKYDVVNGFPLNPKGRTGLTGRGLLDRWGPNHAVDAIVTRSTMMETSVKQVSVKSGDPILQCVLTLRHDCTRWAFPLGFVNQKETCSSAVLRILSEEAINIENQCEEVQKTLKDFFKCKKQVYKGYVDDKRNTDNAWIETTAINFHDENGLYTENIELEPSDNSFDVQWIDMEYSCIFYIPHYEIIRDVLKLHNLNF
ncbi:ADP-ribose pyrophosphatase, mitochondrial [Nephila pilipes]|uniref:ADP-ribose pyrophosphatase, mitochondrial n=1 Tax=Nephila pilipes TaxID=299642 RepID=A0A8X6NQ10_NEPPI|nr:ADP-ribose pyrophosphatase, mitochondrial [Nephila pilipes]